MVASSDEIEKLCSEQPTVTNSAGGSATAVPAGTYKFLGGSGSACLWTRTA